MVCESFRLFRSDGAGLIGESDSYVSVGFAPRRHLEFEALTVALNRHYNLLSFEVLKPSGEPEEVRHALAVERRDLVFGFQSGLIGGRAAYYLADDYRLDFLHRKKSRYSDLLSSYVVDLRNHRCFDLLSIAIQNDRNRKPRTDV